MNSSTCYGGPLWVVSSYHGGPNDELLQCRSPSESWPFPGTFLQPVISKDCNALLQHEHFHRLYMACHLAMGRRYMATWECLSNTSSVTSWEDSMVASVSLSYTPSKPKRAPRTKALTKPVSALEYVYSEMHWLVQPWPEVGPNWSRVGFHEASSELLLKPHPKQSQHIWTF